MNTTALILAFVGLLVFLGHLFVLLFRKTRIPDVLLLILIGFLVGPVFGVVHPDHFGKVGPVLAQIALAIILFQGGHDAQLEVLRENWKSCLLLIFPAFLVAFGVGAGFMRAFTALSLEGCLVFGAILGSTSPSVIVPLVKQLRMRRGPALILMLESAIADVLCIVLVLGFLEAHQAGGLQVGSMAMHLTSSFLLAGLIGVAAGVVWSMLLTKLRSVENNIFLTLALVFVLYGSLDAFHLSGGVAALFFGMTIGNAPHIRIPWLRSGKLGEPMQFTDREKAFFSEMVFLIKTFFFVYLGISLHLDNYAAIALVLVLILITLAFRVPIIRLAMPKSTSVRDASLMAVLAPKGLAAAVLATMPLQQGWAGGELLRDLSYSLILLSIVLNSVLVFLLEASPMSRFYARFFRGFGEEGKEAGKSRLKELPTPRVMEKFTRVVVEGSQPSDSGQRE